MNFANPLALWFFAIAAPIILLYLLKIRRKDYEISSTMLWRMVLRDQQANAPWQKLRRNILLLLQLIILSALVLAVARLVFPAKSIATGSVVLLIDGSASMQAEDVGPNRFAQAIDQAGDLIRSTGSGTTSSAILVSNQPVVLFAGQTDTSEAVRLLSAAQPSNGEADWAAAFSLAGSLGLQGDIEDVTYVILSDGGFPGTDLPPLPGEIEFIQVGEGGGNLAISAMAARTLPSGASAELFVQVSNYSGEVRSAQLTIERSGELLYREQVRLDPQEDARLVFEDLPAETDAYTAEITNIQSDLPLDTFPLDDRAYTVLVPPDVRSVLLVSEGNIFLERLLLLFPNIQASKSVPDENGEISLPNADFDLYIFDGVIPGGELPDAQLLLINPPSNELFEVSGAAGEIDGAVATDHPLARFVDWGEVSVFSMEVIEPPAWAEVVVDSGQGPLVFAGRTGGRRVAVLTFDLHDSDLPLRVAFPILFSNLFEFLAPAGMIASPNGFLPNVPMEIRPPSGTQSLRITSPDGTASEIPVTGDSVLFADTRTPGFYSVVLPEGSGPATVFTINMFSQLESDITPRSEVHIGQAVISSDRPDAVADREAWSWLIGAALAFLMVEWVVYQRRLG